MWRRIDDVPPGDDALAWLYRVAYRVIGHQWRSGSRRLRLQRRLRSVAPGPAPGPEADVVERDRHALVLEAVRRLGDTDSEILRLHVWEQLAATEIADVLDIAPNAVRQRIHRAKRNLGREYRRLAGPPVPTPDAPSGGAR